MKDNNLMVGIETSDDAAVYKLNEDTAIIQTLDFFTPIVDDAYIFGQIAAANSLSDIYAMGGEPLVALNIVCFPSCLPVEILGEILRGGADKVIEAGAVVVGGHSVEDNEPKYGLSVTGEVNPKKVLRNYGCNVGDILILTKPLGIGIINTAIKGGLASEESYKKAVKIMTTLNKYAADIINKYDVTACTDITGFGLMGHSYEMASASKVSFKIYKELIPYIEESREYAEMGIVPEGAYRNKEYLKGKYSLMNVLEWMEDILFDPQTSGGLLFSISKELGENIIEELGKLEIESSIIGEVIPLEENILIVE
ncbi:selenide,water dikinase [Clostridium tetanomorphum]|nr:selenide, water dikinase [Clostridium tetanomorphum DSM 665]MBP1862558.1 selenide,water dikinase [Clostridium tetanomorphum]NRS85601.1 selenide,water dikinase [Clostridium tetanomorphum]NRZ96388.1 selenide,water dikinase [Clostridium tetanomorphum]